MDALAFAGKPAILLTETVRADSSMALPGFPALDAFAAVAMHQSFRRAALERGVSPSALSHTIRGLEQTLDVRLFNRTTLPHHSGRGAPAQADRAGPE